LTVYFPPNASEADITTAMPATVLFYRSSSDTAAKPKSRSLGSAVFWVETEHRFCGAGSAPRSSEPPIEKPEPGAPRVLGSGIELDADLRDLVSLHVAHD